MMYICRCIVKGPATETRSQRSNPAHVARNSSEDVPDKNISQGILQSVGKFWKNHEHEDFQVNIEGECIKCHSFILASCSEFFESLFRSNMKEKLDMKVDLQNIPLNIFQLILKTLYTGCKLLNVDNVLEVWSAAHQLQIHFLIKHCEDFILENISQETVETYRKQADFLQSKRVFLGTHKYILENFRTLRQTELFLQLDVKELCRLIESDQLNASSEDEVLYSIYDWVNYGDLTTQNVQEMVKAKGAGDNTDDNSSINDMDGNYKEEKQAPAVPSQANERKKYLHQLVKATRYFLLSEACINNLFCNKLTKNNTHVKNILFEASAFQNSNNPYRFWPTAAIHRDSSTSEQVGVMYNYGLDVFSLKRNGWLYNSGSYLANVNLQLTTLKDQLYALNNKNNKMEVLHFVNNSWVSVFHSDNETMNLFLSHDKYIYMFSSDNLTIKRFQPHNPGATTEQFHHSLKNAKYAMSFKRYILVFEEVENGQTAKARVHGWETGAYVWTPSVKLGNVWKLSVKLDLSADNMTHFQDEKYVYILDKFGHLYRVEHSEKIQFTFIVHIWDFEAELKGALLFKNKLYLCGVFPENEKYYHEVKDVYSSLKVLRMFRTRSNFVPFVIAKTLLK
uniref:BTB domain-containing protein n=1 Tax=Biomphalaria glabrata TaxID=6526 RepID=A0A2C9KHR2_BIOGL